MINPLNKQRINILYDLLNKIPLAMRITLLLLCLFAFQLHSELTYSQQTKISLNMKNSSIEKILQTIEEKSEFYFLYNSKLIDVDRKTDIRVKEESIASILNRLFNKEDVEYEVQGTQIILHPKEMNRFATQLIADAQQQQKKQITGKITDEKSEPIIGANIVEKGTTNGTVTDIGGNFSLKVEEGAVLYISYIGYLDQEINTVGRTAIDVILQEDTKTLEELVVVGYGIQKKVNVVGSIATVDGKELDGRAQSSVISSLTGKMPGVTITQAGGRPGEQIGTIRVRGIGSFGAEPNALILIDGIPGNLSDVNPNDIANISVLKDASSAAIYGARAANGVVLVTTKMGNEGKVAVTYNGYAGVNKPTALPEMVNTWEYAEALNRAEGITRFTEAEMQAMKDGGMPDLFGNDNYIKEAFSGDGFQTGHDLAVTGGNDRSHYYTSFGYLNQNGIVPKNNYTRYTGRLNLTSKFTDKLDMAVRLRADNVKVEEPNTAGSIDNTRMMGLIQGSLRFPGYRPAVLSDGSWGGGFKNFGTTQAWLASKSLYEKPIVRFNSNIQFNYRPIDGLVVSAIGAYNFASTREKMFKATLPIKIDGVEIVLGPSRLEEKFYNTAYKSFQGTVNYTKTFLEAHNLDLLAGYSWEDETQRDVEASRDNFPSNDLPYLTAGSPENQQNLGGGYDWIIQSFFGRLQYNYKERYLLESTLRYDGSSRFPVNERFGLFPSAAIGWRLSEENFIKGNEKLDFINNLKFKASLGVLGNNNIGNYAFQSVYDLGRDYNYPFGGTMMQGARLTTYTDPNLKWETTRTADVGFETILWNGMLSAEVSYFYRYTYDILYRPNASASAIFGLNMSQVNTGELSNRGWEFSLGHQHRIGNVRYGVNANFSYIKNKIETLGVGDVELANGMIGNGSDLFLGYPMQPYYGYKTDGVFLDQSDIDSWFTHTDQSAMGANKNNTQLGDIRYLDISGPDGVPDGKVDPTYDKVYLGSRIPKYTYGVSLNAEYKGFDVNVFFQGVGGVSGLLNNYAGFAFWSEGNIQRWQYEGAFDPQNPTRYPKYPRLSNPGNAVGVNTQLSDFFVRNASYLRLKNVQIGYTIPQYLLTDTFISNIRIYAAAENPYTWHHYPPGWDPEINSSGEFYPFLKTITFGLNIKF